MKKVVNHICAESYKSQAVEDHLSHQDLWQAQQKYAADIVKAKMDHWNNYLENADSSTIWIGSDTGNPQVWMGQVIVYLPEVKTLATVLS